MEMLNIVWILRGIPYEKVKIAMYGYLAGKHKLSASTEEVNLVIQFVKGCFSTNHTICSRKDCLVLSGKTLVILFQA